MKKYTEILKQIKNERDEFIKKVLKDNARRSYVAEVLPEVLAIWNKYAGKAYGEKTKEKIYNEIKSAAKCGIYIKRGYSWQELHLMPLADNGYNDISTWKYDDFELAGRHIGNGEFVKLLDDNNKIQAVSVGDLKLNNCGEYCDDARRRTDELTAQFIEIRAAIRELNEKIKAYNDKTPSGARHIDRAQEPYYM